jgi:hypothetical protein
MENQQNEAKTVQKVDFLTKTDKETFNLTKEEAFGLLKEENVTDSEQMLTKWCRDGDIAAVRIAKGAPKDRGLMISQRSLEAFILTKTGKVEGLLDDLEKLKKDLANAKKEIRELKASGIRKPRTTKIAITEASLKENTLTFKMDRSKHQAIFEGENIIKIEKNTRQGFEDVTDQVNEEKRNAILKTKKKLS